jgi:hypothetical protein
MGMNSEEDEFKRVEAEALRLWAAQTDDDDDTQVYKKPWAGLTWEDMPEEHAGDSNFLSGARWAEAKLKERNHD